MRAAVSTKNTPKAFRSLVYCACFWNFGYVPECRNLDQSFTASVIKTVPTGKRKLRIPMTGRLFVQKKSK